MTEQARREHAEVIRARYQEADKRERGAMLDEYCRVTGCHRKAAIRRLRAAPQRPRRGSGRPPRYGRDLLPLLAQVWQASDYLSGNLLRPIVPALVSARQRHHGLVVSAAAHAALLAASPATLVAVDVATTWTELQPIWSLHQQRVTPDRTARGAATAARSQGGG